jgi:hypothetical protein
MLGQPQRPFRVFLGSEDVHLLQEFETKRCNLVGFRSQVDQIALVVEIKVPQDMNEDLRCVLLK